MKLGVRRHGGRHRRVWVAIMILLAATVCSIGFLMSFENHMIFYPTRYPVGRWDFAHLPQPPVGQTISIEDVYFAAEDGVCLNGWLAAPSAAKADADALPTLLWFHGNAGNLSDRYEMLIGLVNLSARVLLIDYRGYGRSEGRPSEKGLYLDARAAWRCLTEEHGIAPERIVIFGKSLGGAPAIDLATHVRPAGLIVQSSFTSIPDMAARVFPIVPRFLVMTKMDSLSKIRGIHVPKLFIHSPADEVVPYDMGRRLYDAAPEPKTFYTVAGAPHNETWIVGGKAYWDAIREFVSSAVHQSL
ncbi:MAG: alpha/beta hydrolase [Acidobacteria bacterium]|nr:alpha/beta hydrolase [Acidobacteriota bacterium]